MKRLKKPASIITLFLLLSLLLHLIIGFMLSKLALPDQSRQINKQQVTFVDLPQTPKRVADIAKPKIQEIPHKPSAQSLYNQSVKEEQVAPQTGPTIINKANQNKVLAKPEAEKKDNQKNETKIKPDEKIKEFDSSKTKQEESKTKPDEPVAKVEEKIPGMPEKIPSRLGGDYLPNIKIGNTTYINTLANPNVAYFVELKHKFSLTWSPIRILRPQIGRLPSGSISVMMGVTVNSTGELVRLNVLRPSGVDGYDEEAIRTVRASAPFSSPPANLLENGILNMAWSFIINH